MKTLRDIAPRALVILTALTVLALAGCSVIDPNPEQCADDLDRLNEARVAVAGLRLDVAEAQATVAQVCAVVDAAECADAREKLAGIQGSLGEAEGALGEIEARVAERCGE